MTAPTIRSYLNATSKAWCGNTKEGMFELGGVVKHPASRHLEVPAGNTVLTDMLVLANCGSSAFQYLAIQGTARSEEASQEVCTTL